MKVILSLTGKECCKLSEQSLRHLVCHFWSLINISSVFNGSYQTLLHLLLPVCLGAVSLGLLLVYFSPHNPHFSSLFESQACSAGQLMESRFFTHSGSFFPFSLYLYNTQFVIFLKPKKREVLSSSRLKSAAAY